MAEEENGRLPKLVQERKVDGIIVIGKMMDDYLQHLNTEAGIPVIYLDYYNGYNTITQNSAGDIIFDVDDKNVDIYVGKSNYSVDYLTATTEPMN